LFVVVTVVIAGTCPLNHHHPNHDQRGRHSIYCG